MIKLCETVLYLLVKYFQLVMKIFPWRASILDERLKKTESIYDKACQIIIEGIQTLLDLFLFLLIIPPVLVFTPYKFKYLANDFKTHKPDQWRRMLFGYFINVALDIPYILMLLAIGVSVV